MANESWHACGKARENSRKQANEWQLPERVHLQVVEAFGGGKVQGAVISNVLGRVKEGREQRRLARKLGFLWPAGLLSKQKERGRRNKRQCSEGSLLSPPVPRQGACKESSGAEPKRRDGRQPIRAGCAFERRAQEVSTGRRARLPWQASPQRGQQAGRPAAVDGRHAACVAGAASPLLRRGALPPTLLLLHLGPLQALALQERRNRALQEAVLPQQRLLLRSLPLQLLLSRIWREVGQRRRRTTRRAAGRGGQLGQLHGAQGPREGVPRNAGVPRHCMRSMHSGQGCAAQRGSTPPSPLPRLR